MDLWYINIDSFPDALISSVLSFYPLEIANEINRYHKTDDKKRRLISRLLVQKYMMDHYGDWQWNDWSKNGNHKPEIKNRPYFNISHSGKIVAVGFNEQSEIGIDIEEIKEVDVASYIHFFHPEEKLFLSNKLLDFNHFYSIWTKKEAFLKAVGIGLLQGLDFVNVLIQPINNIWYLHEIETEPGYQCTVCSTSDTNTITIQRIDQTTLNHFIHEKILI